MNKRKIVIAITGASGSIYAKLLLDALNTLQQNQGNNTLEVGVLLSDNAKTVWKTELENEDFKHLPFKFYDKNDFNAPFASGSAKFDTMVVIPCSMGTLGRIANGTSNDLLTRAADVILKERRKLILVARETPYSLIHINNMKTVTEAGGIICPATPSFYSQPKSIEEVAKTVVDRVLDLMALDVDSYRWGE
jgi:4-hydroxy-3-polyprenylbenzoate decarboxylase